MYKCSLECKHLFRSCLVAFTIYSIRNRSCHLGVLVFNSGIFDLTCGWFGRFVVLFSSRVVPSAVPAKFRPSSDKNPNNGVEFMYVFEWGFDPSWSCELKTLRRKNFHNKVGPPSGGNPNSGVEFGRAPSGKKSHSGGTMRIQAWNDKTWIKC